MRPSVFVAQLDYTFIFAAVFIGVVVSLFWYERELLSPGGVVVPGFVALFLLLDPWIVLYTIVIALLTTLVINRASKFAILFGRRRFSVTMLASMTLTLVLQYIFGAFPLLHNLSARSGPYAGFQVIGIIIPGLIANEMHRQGLFPTLSTMSVVSVITAVITIAISGFL